MRALVADDEAPARRKLCELLAHEADVEVVGEAADGEEAVAAIRATTPDVVFLDIQMPRLDGFGVIAAIGTEHMPTVVFVTAYDEHALRAFEVHAVDYLLKPYAPKRLQHVVARLRRQQTAPAADDLATRIAGLLATARGTPQYLQQILLDREAGRQVMVPLGEVDLIRADANYLVFVTPRREYRRRGTLGDFASRLDPAAFVRLSRSEIVRVGAIREVQPWFHGDARVLLQSGQVCKWSRRYRAQRDSLF
jgi:two-component system, LytTR family, response regulator